MACRCAVSTCTQNHLQTVCRAEVLTDACAVLRSRLYYNTMREKMGMLSYKAIAVKFGNIQCVGMLLFICPHVVRET